MTLTTTTTTGRAPRRLLPLLGAASAVALALTACSGSSAGGEPGSGETVDPDEEITLRLDWWGNDDRAQRYNEAIELFEEEYRSEEHTSELQSRGHIVCRLLLEKKKMKRP